jgi:hypothetical protein
MNDRFLFEFLVEQNILKTTQTKPIVDAINKKRKITFDYYGPRKPKKDSVRPGRRIKAEPYAIGLSKKGKLIVRMWIEPPSISKKGFDKTKWRTFMIARMKNIVITDETFVGDRPGYKQGDDGSMSVTYVSLDRSTQPKQTKPKSVPPKKVEPIVKPEKKVEPKPKPEPLAKKKEPLPQPKPEKKPEPIVKKKEEPVKPEPTQKKPEVPTEKLPEPKPEEKPVDTDNLNNKENIQEKLLRIKSLMYS